MRLVMVLEWNIGYKETLIQTPDDMDLDAEWDVYTGELKGGFVEFLLERGATKAKYDLFDANAFHRWVKR